MKKSIITINGRQYNAVTGELVSNAAAHTQPTTNKNRRVYSDIAMPTKRPSSTRQSTAASHAIHQRPQKSQTLHRKALKKPEAVAHPLASRRSPMISKFHAHQTEQPTIKPSNHKVAETKQNQHATAPKPAQPNPATSQPLTGSALKEQLIKERLNEISNARNKRKMPKLLRKPRMATLLTASLAALVFGGYLTYINLPTVSMKVAASKAGIAATVPNYKPAGYSLNGPISYSPGEVVVRYQSNTKNTAYQLIERASNWDSQALLDNYVAKNTNNYQTILDRGLTIYTFDSKAMWVSGGLLYTIEGDALLSTDQILKIAASI